MAALTDEEMLEQIKLEIENVVKGGQAVTIFGSRSVTRVSLKELYEMRNDYERRIARASGYTGVNTADFSNI